MKLILDPQLLYTKKLDPEQTIRSLEQLHAFRKERRTNMDIEFTIHRIVK